MGSASLDEREELRRLAEAATPGPWRWLADSGEVMLWGPGDPGGEGHVLTPHVCPACRERGAPCLGPNDPDAAYIAAVSPDVVLGLLDELEQSRAVLNAVAELHAAEDETGRLAVSAPTLDQIDKDALRRNWNRVQDARKALLYAATPSKESSDA